MEKDSIVNFISISKIPCTDSKYKVVQLWRKIDKIISMEIKIHKEKPITASEFNPSVYS